MFGPASSPTLSRARCMRACMVFSYHLVTLTHPKFTSVKWLKFTTEIGNCEIHVNQKISVLNEMKQNELKVKHREKFC